MRRLLLNLLLVLVLIVIVSVVTLALDGEEILDKVDEVFNSDSSDYNMTMAIINSNGYKRERSIRLISKDSDKFLVRFLSPADLEGTGFLTITQDGKDNMWLFLPALGNIRRIASHQKNGSFMGTDFTYKDISIIGGSDYRNDYESKLIGEEEYNNYKCILLESIPTDDNIDYSKMKMWVKKDNYVPLKLEFYDQNNKLLKIMTNSNIERVDGHLTVQKVLMENIQKNTKTILTIDKVAYDLKIPDTVFTTRYLQRGQ